MLHHAVKEAVYLLNQDGDEPVDQGARQRGIVLGPQQPDGSFTIRGRVTAEFGATLGTVIGKWGAPGMCNPENETPCVSGTPSQEQIDADTRTASQRTHDALLALGRSALMSGELGQHNGLPVSIMVVKRMHCLFSAGGPR